MDFLDQKFASVGRAKYSEFLGIGNNNKKANITAQTEAEQNLLDRYPFSSDCETQKKIVNDLLAESAELLQRRNSAKKGPSRNNMSAWLDAYDAYIPAAKQFMDEVSCSVSQTPVVPVVPVPVTPVANDPVLNTAVVNNGKETAAASAAADMFSIFKTPMSNTLKYSLIGLGVVLVVVIGIAIVKRN